MPLRRRGELIREISDAGPSSREGCGNTIRNVTGDPWAGITEGEPFDITPYAAAYARYFVRHPDHAADAAQGQDGVHRNDEDVAITGIHDIGFIPARESGRRGPRGRDPGRRRHLDHARVAPTLYDFVEVDNGDYLKVAEAALRIFDRQEWLRVNRARARIKVLIDKIGIDAFREMVEEELEGDWVDERDFDDRAPAVQRRRGGERADRRRRLRLAERRRLRVRPLHRGQRQPQRQEGFSTVRSRSPAAT